MIRMDVSVLVICLLRIRLRRPILLRMLSRLLLSWLLLAAEFSEWVVLADQTRELRKRIAPLRGLH
jgi:hypothetical protein